MKIYEIAISECLWQQLRGGSNKFHALKCPINLWSPTTFDRCHIICFGDAWVLINQQYKSDTLEPCVCVVFKNVKN